MACNGFNHPKECKCNFRGGHPNSRPPSWRGWRPRAVRRYISGPNARCPECHLPVYWVPNSRGGGAYCDHFGPPWPKHPCTDMTKRYSPYGRSGKPKLTAKKTELQREGWLPFIVRNIEPLASGVIVHGVVLDNPTVRHLGSLESLSIDRELPIFIRPKPQSPGVIEFDFFPEGKDDHRTVSVFDDCRTDFDLLLRKAG